MVERSKGSNGRMPNGWWPMITNEYNQKFDQTVTTTTVKNRYTRWKNQQTSTRPSGSQTEERERQLPPIITNTELYTRVKNGLVINIDRATSQQIDRPRTKKVYSQEVNHQVIQMLNLVVEREEFETIYPEFAKIAKDEGFADIAKSFELVAKVEKTHSAILNCISKNYDNKSLYKYKGKSLVKCSNCGHIDYLSEGWQKCPLCNLEQGYIELNFTEAIEGATKNE